MKQLFILLTATSIATTTFAASPSWKLKPTESSITFTATQNNAPVSGKFTTFTGDIAFSPDQLNDSKATITVDMNSVTTSYALVGETLKTEDWFDVKKFPKAVFKSTSITKTSDKTFQVNGTLTIRDKTVPTVLKLTQEKFSATEAKFTGSTTLKRTAFGIGSGEWSKTDDVKDDVTVQFTVSATK